MPEQRPDALTDASIEHFTERISRQWLYNRQLVIYVVQDGTRQAVDDAIMAMSRTMDEWPAKRRYAALIDFTPIETFLFPYARQRIAELRAYRPELRGAVAVLMRNNVVTEFIRIYFRSGPKTARQTQIFGNRQAALDWLVERIGSVAPGSESTV